MPPSCGGGSGVGCVSGWDGRIGSTSDGSDIRIGYTDRTYGSDMGEGGGLLLVLLL